MAETNNESEVKDIAAALIIISSEDEQNVINEIQSNLKSDEAILLASVLSSIASKITSYEYRMRIMGPIPGDGIEKAIEEVRDIREADEIDEAKAEETGD